MSKAAQSYALRNASVDDLWKLPRTEAVYEAILNRPDASLKALRESLAGLDRLRWLVIPGWRYRWFVACFTRLPLWLREAIQIRTPYRRTSNGALSTTNVAAANSVDSK